MSFPNLPHVSLGNLATNVSDAGGDFIQGLVQQRLRQQQIAMQQALQQAQIGHLGAQTGLTEAQTGAIPGQEAHLGAATTAITQGTDPIGEPELALFKKFMPSINTDLLRGMPRAEAEKLLSVLPMLQLRGIGMSNLESYRDFQEADHLRADYDRDDKMLGISKGVQDYRQALLDYQQSSQSGNPYAAEGSLLTFLRGRTNRMNQAEINRISRLGGLENWMTRLQSYVVNKSPIDQESLSALRDVAASVGQAHVRDFQDLNTRYTQRSQGITDPRNVINSDLGNDIPGLEQQTGVSSARPGPAGGTAGGIPGYVP